MKTVVAVLFIAMAMAVASQDEITREFRMGPAKLVSDRLRAAGIEFHVDQEGFARVTGFENDRLKLRILGLEIEAEEKGKPFSLAPPAGYHTPEELLAEFQGIAANFSSIAQLIDLTETYKTPVSHEGRHIYALKISDNVQEDEAEPNILYVTNHHSRELMTPEMALNASLHLVQNYRTDPRVKSIVDGNQIYVMWTMNPDGLAYVWSTDNMWRKNRNRNSGGSYGVDLNRNYPIGWDFSCGGSTIQTSEEYRGPSAASEPETKTMIAFQSERRFAKVLDYHSYAREVRIIYADCASLPSQLNAYFRDIAVDVADIMRYVQARSCCMGGNVHFAYHDQSSLTFLVETGTAFQPNSEVMKQELARVLPGTMYFFSLPIPLSGRVLDRNTGRPVEAQLIVNSLTFELEEQNFSNPRNGLYHLWLPNGTWSISVVASGYPRTTVTLIANGQATVTDILLG